jgi:hypothetical protein
MHFDAHVNGTNQSALDGLRLEGAILFCPQPDQVRMPAGNWIRASIVQNLTQTEETAVVLDLQLLPGELLQRLKRPKPEWFPLLESVRLKRQFVRFNPPPGASTVVGVKKLSEHFPNARFLIDPFQHGPPDGWQAQVRLAECDNIWLTTLGLPAGPACRWPRFEDVSEAFHFTMGEVGASKLLFASGQDLNGDEQSSGDPQKWLEEIKALDEDQRALILRLNARDLFGSNRE